MHSRPSESNSLNSKLAKLSLWGIYSTYIQKIATSKLWLRSCLWLKCIRYNFTLMFLCLNVPAAAPLTCLPKACLKNTMVRLYNRAATFFSPCQKWPLTPIIPLSTCPLQFECLSLPSPRPPSLLGNLLCKYGLLTADGPFQLWRWKCNYRQQTSPLLSLEGATLISVPSAKGAVIDRYQLWGGDY